MNEKQIIKKYNDTSFKKPKEKLPIECKIILHKEINRLTRILKILNRVDKFQNG